MYRARQFFTALTARVSETELAEADELLPAGAGALFRRMPRDGQAHALRVARDLKRAGETHPSLLAAALLHDAGKSAAHLTPLTRSIFVVLKRLAPNWLSHLADTGWRKPLVALRDHPRIGADWARRAGCDELTAWLIEHHPDHLDDVSSDRAYLLRALQAVDDEN